MPNETETRLEAARERIVKAVLINGFACVEECTDCAAAAEAQVADLEAAARAGAEATLMVVLTETIPVLKGFCDMEFTPDGSEAGYAQVVRGYTPQGIYTLNKLVAIRDVLMATEEGAPDA